VDNTGARAPGDGVTNLLCSMSSSCWRFHHKLSSAVLTRARGVAPGADVGGDGGEGGGGEGGEGEGVDGEEDGDGEARSARTGRGRARGGGTTKQAAGVGAIIPVAPRCFRNKIHAPKQSVKIATSTGKITIFGAGVIFWSRGGPPFSFSRDF
jgi:hypothetical protein